MPVNNQTGYEKQNLFLNLSINDADNKGSYLDTCKYYLLFMHPTTGVNTKNMFIPAIRIDEPPMRSASPITIPYGGEMQYYQPSATSYNPVRATLMDTDDLATRMYLQKLLLSFARPTEKTHLMKVALIIFDRDNTHITTFEMHNAFLSSISPISLNWQAVNQPAYYSIDIQYSHVTDTTNTYNLEDVIDYYEAITNIW